MNLIFNSILLNFLTSLQADCNLNDFTAQPNRISQNISFARKRIPNRKDKWLILWQRLDEKRLLSTEFDKKMRHSLFALLLAAIVVANTCKYAHTPICKSRIWRWAYICIECERMKKEHIGSELMRVKFDVYLTLCVGESVEAMCEVSARRNSVGNAHMLVSIARKVSCPCTLYGMQSIQFRASEK